MAIIGILKIAPRKNDPPFPSHIKVILSQYSKDKDGNILLSPELMTETEIDYSIDLLIKQLENARKQAKKAINKSK